MVNFLLRNLPSLKTMLLLALVVGIDSISMAQQDVQTQADEMPYFMGCQDLNVSSEEKRSCSNANLVRFVANELVYPETAKAERLEGTVYVSFVVNEQGKAVEAKLIRDIGGGCGASALDIIRKMPRWEPGQHAGKTVAVQLNLPVHFTFKSDALTDRAQTYQINWGNLAANTVNKSELEANLKKPIRVRDAFGNEKAISELIFSYEKKRSFIEGSSTGKINNDIRKVISKSRKGGLLLITAIIQEKNDYIYVKRSFEVR